jgi:hypothetical protein
VSGAAVLANQVAQFWAQEAHDADSMAELLIAQLLAEAAA